MRELVFVCVKFSQGIRLTGVKRFVCKMDRSTEWRCCFPLVLGLTHAVFVPEDPKVGFMLARP